MSTPIDSASLNQVMTLLVMGGRTLSFCSFLPFLAYRVIPTRFRLFLGITLTLAFWSVLWNKPIPQLSWSTYAFGLLVKEVLIGALLGISAAFLINAITIAAGLISQSVALSNAFIAHSPGSMGGGTAVLEVLLELSFLMFLITCDGHLTCLRTLWHSFGIIPVDQWPLLNDFTVIIINITALIFKCAFMIASPFLIIHIITSATLGIMNRMVPSFPLLFIMQPTEIFIGWTLLLLLIPRLFHTPEQLFKTMMISFFGL